MTSKYHRNHTTSKYLPDKDKTSFERVEELLAIDNQDKKEEKKDPETTPQNPERR